MNTPLPSTTQAGSPRVAHEKPGPLPGSLVNHRRQAFWQIWVPLGMGGAILLALAVVAGFGASVGSPGLVRWTNISLIFLIIPVALAALAFVLLFTGFIFLLSRLLHFLPTYTQLGQAYAHSISVLVRAWSDRAASPFLGIRSSWAGFLTLWRKLFKH